MDLDKLPDSLEETDAEIELLNLIRGQMTAIRKGDRDDLALAAMRQIKRCDDRLSKLEHQKKRFGNKNAVKA